MVRTVVFWIVVLVVVALTMFVWPLYDTSVITMASPTRTLVEAYYINMDDRPDRQVLFETTNQKFISEVPTHRWSGVKVSMPQLSKTREAAYGCKKAHVSLLRHISTQPSIVNTLEAWYLVLEDDSKIDLTFDAHHIFAMKAFAPKNMGVIQLCNSLHCEYPGNIIKSIIYPKINFVLEYRAAAYMIRPEAAGEMVDLFQTCSEEHAFDWHWRLFRPPKTHFLARGICAIKAAGPTVTKSSIEI